MKSTSRKKFLALLAAGSLAVGGIAWASVQNGVITPNTQDSAMNTAGSFALAANGIDTTSVAGFGVASSGTQTGAVALPDGGGLALATDPTNPTSKPAPAGKSTVVSFWHTSAVLDNTNPSTGTAVAGTGPRGWDRQNVATIQVVAQDAGGVIELASGEHLVLQPGTGKALTGADVNFTEVSAFSPLPTAVEAAFTAGMMRIRGGETTVYGGNANSPITTSYNSFNGGTFIMGGKLNVAHSNAFGEGHVMLAENTTLRAFDNDTSLGYIGYGADRKNLSTAQYLFLRRMPAAADNTFATGDLAGANAAAETTGRSRANTTVVADGVQFSIYSGIREFLTRNGIADTDDAAQQVSVPLYPAGGLFSQPGLLNLIYGSTLVKDGSNEVLITSDLLGGAWHTRGTTVNAGTLNVKSTGTRIYAASLGRAWNGDTTVDEDLRSAYVNYNTAVTDGRVVPYKNYLTIAEDAQVILNRDQFFGQFSGKGGFHVDNWNFAGVPGGKKLPQITIQTDASTIATGGNSYNNGDFSEENVFSGKMSGTFDLVLHTGYRINGANGPVVPLNSTTAWRKVLKLTGENNDITSGDTTIVNGILSVRTVENLPPGSIFVGANSNRNSYKAHLPHTGGFQTNFATADDERHMMATFHANGSFATRDGQLVTIGTPQMNNGMLERTRGGNNDYVYPGPRRDFTAAGENDDHAVLAGDRSTVMQLGNVEAYSAFVVNEEFRVSENLLNIPRNWEGEVHFTDRYVFPNSTVANPTNVTIDRGMLHLEKLPADITAALLNEKGHFDVQINPTGILSLGDTARDFSDVMNVTFGAVRNDANATGEDDQRIRVIVKPGDLYTSKTDARQADAIFQAGHIDYVGLGSGQANRDKRIVIQLDLSQVSNKLAKGTWIKVIESPQAINWNNLHFLRESSDTRDEDYAKVRVAYTNDVTIDGDHLRARLDENMYAIYVYADADIDENTDPVDETNFSFTNTTATNSLIEGSVNLADASIGNVASADVTVYLFHGGVSTTDNANAIANVSGVTNASGTMAYRFTPDADGFGYSTNYILKAVSTGYKDGTRSITTDASDIIWSDSSSGCDAGFGIFALIAAAGGALVLRKKD